MDLDLLNRFALGDLDAFESLFRQHQGEVYGWIVTIIRDPAAAEDLTLETFWRIHRAHSRFDPDRSFGAWARRIAMNVALDHLKRARREPEPDTGQADACAAAAAQDSAVAAEVRAAIERAFRTLPARLQIVAILALIEQRTQTEIAETLGISVAAVKSREFRAIRLLRKKLKRLGVEP